MVEKNNSSSHCLVVKFGGHNLNGFEVIQLFSEGGGGSDYLFIYFVLNIDKPLKKGGVY